MAPRNTVVVFVWLSIYEPSYDSDGFRVTARLLASYVCYFGCCRSRRKPVPWPSIVKSAPVWACGHPLGVVDGVLSL